MLLSGLKRAVKKPVRIILFLLLLTVTVTFLSVGITLFITTAENMKNLDANFRTIGTVDQKESEIVYSRKFDRVRNRYELNSTQVYKNPVSIELLNFDGANYIYPPENRPYYHVASNDLVTTAGVYGFLRRPIVEYKVVEEYGDGIIPVKVEVVNPLNNYVYHKGDVIYLCQHYGEDPIIWDENKTYISMIDYDRMQKGQGIDDLAEWPETPECVPILYFRSAQIDRGGNILEDDKYAEIEELGIIEVIEDLYETDVGKRLLEIIDIGLEYEREFYVTPTNSLALLMDFYNHNTYMVEGREINQEEFDTGKAVCMVQSKMASRNGWKVGDKISLDFMNSVYGRSLSGGETTEDYYYINYGSIIDANGKAHAPFFEESYELVGIYERVTEDAFDSYSVGFGTVIVPSKSITASDENHLNGDMILKPYNVSFEIPNGTSGQYMEKVKELGLDEILEFTFYDRGYENLKSGIQSIQEMATVLLLAGGITTLATLFFFTFIFIGREKKSMAIERSLGVTKKITAASMLISVMAVVVIGSAVGALSGAAVSRQAFLSVQQLTQESTYDTDFSSWANILGEGIGTAGSSAADKEGFEEDITPEADSLPIAAAVFVAVFLSELLIAFAFIRRNLKQEPIRLLSSQ